MSTCVECGSWDSKTLETRKDTRYWWIWRRKKCHDCGATWATYEVPVQSLTAEASNPDGKLERR